MLVVLLVGLIPLCGDIYYNSITMKTKTSKKTKTSDDTISSKDKKIGSKEFYTKLDKDLGNYLKRRGLPSLAEILQID